jgi:hypothetical protein
VIISNLSNFNHLSKSLFYLFFVKDKKTFYKYFFLFSKTVKTILSSSNKFYIYKKL